MPKNDRVKVKNGDSFEIIHHSRIKKILKCSDKTKKKQIILKFKTGAKELFFRVERHIY